MTKYDNEDWEDLPGDIKKAAKVLGYTEKLWDNSKEPATCQKDYEELTSAEKAAAAKLGYTEEIWDAEAETAAPLGCPCSLFP